MQSKQLCANGRPGYRMEGDGAQYHPNPPCNRPAMLGHIYCPQCYTAAGGAGEKIPLLAPQA